MVTSTVRSSGRGTRLRQHLVYLSGNGAASVAELFDAGAADAVVLDGDLTSASAGLPRGFHSAAAEIYRRLGGQADESFPVAHEQTLTDLLVGAEPAPFDPTR